VGALQQSHDLTLPIEVIYQHMAPWLFPSEVHRTISPLVIAGIVESGAKGKIVRLTARGQSVRRNVGKSAVPYYWPLVLPVGVEPK
jgi:hypothetical protein